MAKSFVVSAERAAGETTVGQGKAIRFSLSVDIRTMKKALTFGAASEIISMTVALRDAVKAGGSIQMANEAGEIETVKVTPTLRKKLVKDIAEQLIKAGAEDKREAPKAKKEAPTQALVFGRPDLVKAMNKK